MRTGFVFALVIFMSPDVIFARRKREKATLLYEDCGHPAQKTIFFEDVQANPMPIISPGTLHVTMAGNVTEDLPRDLMISVKIVKYFLGLPVMIPCFNDVIGSCTYENICDMLQKYEDSGCPRTLKSHEIQCHCPIMSGHFSINNLPVNIPRIGGIAGAFLNGEGCPSLAKRFKKADVSRPRKRTVYV